MLAESLVIGPLGQIGGNNGTLRATTTNYGKVAPGNSPGTLTIDGDFIMGESGLLQIEVGGLGAGQFDHLIVTGSVTLGGTLETLFTGGFAPSAGDTLEFLDVSGNFSGNSPEPFTFPNLLPGFKYETSYTGGRSTLTALNDGELMATPESSTYLMVLVAAITLAIVRLPRLIPRNRLAQI